MNLISRWFRKPETIQEIDPQCWLLKNEDAFKKLAIESAVDLIANVVAQVEFVSYEKNKKVKSNAYYAWNVRPNVHESKGQFIKKLVRTMLLEENCLVVVPDKNTGYMYVADGWTCLNEKALRPNVFSNVSINNYTLTSKFSEEDVLFLKYSDIDMKQLLDAFYQKYGLLISSAMNIYKRSNAKRFAIKGNLFRAQDTQYQKDLNDMMTEQFETFLEADNAGAVFQLDNEYSLEDFSTSGGKDSSDIRELMNDIFDLVARAFHIPKGILRGDTVGVSEQVDAFLMFSILPIVEIIEDEINAKFVAKQDYLNGSRIKADTSKLKLTDINKKADSLYKLFQIGAKSINDCILDVDGDPINEDWANTHYVTKNFTTAKEDAENAAKGGDEND